MGRTALYRDPVPFRPARAEVELDPDGVVLKLPQGNRRRCAFDGCVVRAVDGVVVAVRPAAENDDDALSLTRSWSSHVRVPAPRTERRFVRMLEIERANGDRHVLVTPPDQGAVAPNVVRVPEAPSDAAIIDARAWNAVADWVLGGGRLGAFSIADLARIAQVASSGFAVVIGEVAAQRALELAWAGGGPHRGSAFGGPALESEVAHGLGPLVEAARESPRAAEALVSALAYVAGAVRPKLRARRHLR